MRIITTGLAVMTMLFCVHVFAEQAEPIVDPKIEKRFKDITSELRCQKCQNQTIYDSKAGLADDLKRQVRDQIHAGKTDDEIVDYMVARYGDFIRYRPAMDAKNLFLWVGPFVFLIVGVIVLMVQLRKRRQLIQDVPLSAEEAQHVQQLINRDGGEK
jgi:cytochrome c-type biogenesis protein CcmH